MYNNGFPVTYPQMFPQLQQTQPQGMTPPTIHADIVQVGSEDEAWSWPVAAGSTQMMMDRDDSAIYIKSAYPNSQPTLDIYRKDTVRPQKRDADYVTHDELVEALKALKTHSEGEEGAAAK